MAIKYGTSYKLIFDILKRGDIVSFHKDNRQGIIQAIRIVEAGLAEWSEMDFPFYRIKPIQIQNTIAPKPAKSAPPATETHILVSHWRDGDRKDKFAHKYEFVSRVGEWVKYRDVTGNIATVKAEYTMKAVA